MAREDRAIGHRQSPANLSQSSNQSVGPASLIIISKYIFSNISGKSAYFEYGETGEM